MIRGYKNSKIRKQIYPNESDNTPINPYEEDSIFCQNIHNYLMHMKKQYSAKKLDSFKDALHNLNQCISKADYTVIPYPYYLFEESNVIEMILNTIIFVENNFILTDCFIFLGFLSYHYEYCKEIILKYKFFERVDLDKFLVKNQNKYFLQLIKLLVNISMWAEFVPYISLEKINLIIRSIFVAADTEVIISVLDFLIVILKCKEINKITSRKILDAIRHLIPYENCFKQDERIIAKISNVLVHLIKKYEVFNIEHFFELRLDSFVKKNLPNQMYADNLLLFIGYFCFYFPDKYTKFNVDISDVLRYLSSNDEIVDYACWTLFHIILMNYSSVEDKILNIVDFIMEFFENSEFKNKRYLSLILILIYSKCKFSNVLFCSISQVLKIFNQAIYLGNKKDQEETIKVLMDSLMNIFTLLRDNNAEVPDEFYNIIENLDVLCHELNCDFGISKLQLLKNIQQH